MLGYTGYGGTEEAEVPGRAEEARAMIRSPFRSGRSAEGRWGGGLACLDCCMWNHLHVDTPKCAKQPPRKRRRCREEATQKLADCQVLDCDQHGILTGLEPQATASQVA